MYRNSFIFNRSYYEAIVLLPRDIQGEVFTAIMEYGLDGITTENLKPIARSIFTIIKSHIDADFIALELREKTDAKKVVDRGLVVQSRSCGQDQKKVVDRGLVVQSRSCGQDQKKVVDQSTTGQDQVLKDLIDHKTLKGFCGSKSDQIDPADQKILTDFCEQEMTYDTFFEKLFNLSFKKEGIEKPEGNKYACKILWNALKSDEDRLQAYIYAEKHTDKLHFRLLLYYLRFKDWETDRFGKKKKNKNNTNKKLNNVKEEIPEWKKELLSRFPNQK